MNAATRACVLVLLLAACTYYGDPSLEEVHIIAPGNFTKGSGVVTSVGVLPRANMSPGKDGDRNLYRLFLRMDRTGTQFVDVDKSTFMAGDAVELTNDGRVLRVTGTTINDALRR